MKSFALLGLLVVGGFVVWKHHVHATTAKTPTSDVPNGVSMYPTIPAPQQPQQLLAPLQTNPDAVSDPGFSAAFGAFENQPGDGEVLY